MLPTQGQGASQSIEDAEALRAFFADVQGRPTKDDVADMLQVRILLDRSESHTELLNSPSASSRLVMPVLP